MNGLNSLARLLVFPGLLLAVPAAWFVLWLERKAVAVMQRRIGPPFAQPVFDFIKLLGKTPPPRTGLNGALMRAWPVIAVSAAAGAVGLLPVLPSFGGFEGDLILLLALMEIPAICMVVAGFTSNSLFGQIGSAREAVLLVSYNLLFLLAAVSIAVSGHSFRLEVLASGPVSFARYLGLLAIVLCLPAKLHVNPFSLPNAEQEIYSGAMTEYAGSELAMWQLSHGLEWIAGVGLVAALAVPGSLEGWLQVPAAVGVGLLLVLLLSMVTAATARVAIDTAVRFYWQCAMVFMVLALSSAAIARGRS
jgi:formate hydrogenlyase subunit 4